MRTVIVTGAASGIGLAQVKAFLAEGDKVYALDCADKPQNFPKEAIYIQKSAQEVETVTCLQQLECVDVLCNTCGKLDGFKPLLEMSDELWETIWISNVTSQMKMMRFVLPKMLPYHQGCVINMASIAGLVPGGGGLAYTASKHAIVGMTKQMTFDYGDKGIRFNAIAPGAVNTPMNQADFAGDGHIAQSVASMTPAKRYATAEEIATLTLFLASEQSAYMNGSVIPIDGGWMNRNDGLNL